MVRRRLDAAGDVVAEVAKLSEEQGVLCVPNAAGDGWGDLGTTIAACLPLLQTLGVGNTFFEGTIRKLSSRLTSQLPTLSQHHPEVLLSSLQHLAPFSSSPSIATLSVAIAGSLLQRKDYTVQKLPQNTQNLLQKESALTMPDLEGRAKVWCHCLNRLTADILTLRKLADYSGFAYQRQTDFVLNFAARMGPEGDVFLDRKKLPPMFRSIRPLTTALNPALIAQLQNVHVAVGDSKAASFFFCTFYHHWAVLPALVALGEEIYGASTDGFVERPASLAQFGSMQAVLNDEVYKGEHCSLALRMPFVSSALHFAVFYITDVRSIQAKNVLAGLFKLLKRVHMVRTTDTVLTAYLNAVHSAVKGEMAALSTIISDTSDVVLIALSMHLFVALLSSGMTVHPMLDVLLRGLGVSIPRSSGTHWEDHLALTVTAVGQSVQRSRAGALSVAGMVAEHLLIPLKRAGKQQSSLESFLFKACTYVHMPEELPKSVKDLEG